MTKTSIQIDAQTRDRLRAAKVGGESYDDLINRLLDDDRDDGSNAPGTPA
jgi:predicted CopG family antitoxin